MTGSLTDCDSVRIWDHKPPLDVSAVTECGLLSFKTIHKYVSQKLFFFLAKRFFFLIGGRFAYNRIFAVLICIDSGNNV